MKTVFKRFFWTAIILSCIAIATLGYYFISNDAPVIHGKVIHHIKFKDKLTLDLYLPTRAYDKKTPVVLFVHGGAWVGGSKVNVNINRFHGAFNSLRENGYAIVSPDYTLASHKSSPFPNCIMDVFDAIGWMADNATEYNFDMENWGIFGESAGAHIAMMTTYADAGLFSSDSTSMQPNYVVDVYGPTYLKDLYHAPTADSIDKQLAKLPDGLREHFNVKKYLFGFDPEKHPVERKQFMQKYSPISYLKSSLPPTLIIHGDSDRVVPIGQSLVLKEKLDSLNVEHEIHILQNVDHAFLNATEKDMENVQKWIVEFIEKHSK